MHPKDRGIERLTKFERSLENTSAAWIAKIEATKKRRKNTYGVAVGAIAGLGIAALFMFSDTNKSATQPPEDVSPAELQQPQEPNVGYRGASTEVAGSRPEFLGLFEIPQIDPAAHLNPAWKDRYSRFDRRGGMSAVPLSKAGYPVVVTRMPIALCQSPTEVQMARDLVVSGRLEKARQLPTCLVFTDQVPGEWVGINAFDRNIVTLRLHPKGRPPVDLYGPSAEGSDNPLFGWFGTIAR